MASKDFDNIYLKVDEKVHILYHDIIMLEDTKEQPPTSITSVVS